VGDVEVAGVRMQPAQERGGEEAGVALAGDESTDGEELGGDAFQLGRGLPPALPPSQQHGLVATAAELGAVPERDGQRTAVRRLIVHERDDVQDAHG